MMDMNLITPLEEVLVTLSEKKRPVLAAVDGRCAAGKTTLAQSLAQRFGWSVIHMDDFFLRPEQRTSERYEEPGGNLDRERFLEEVLIPLREGTLTSYRPFDCGRMCLREPVRFQAGPVVLIEGAYACHPDLADLYDIRIFMDTDAETQRRRVTEREGADRAGIFFEKWIPLEEKYFAAFEIVKRCEFRLFI